MRVKKDSGSWHASGVINRDKRHDKSFDGATGKPKKKKDTKRWCKGKEGRVHELEWREMKWSASTRSVLKKRSYTMEIVCTKCGRSVFADFGFAIGSGWPERWVKNPPKKKMAILNEWREKLGPLK